MKSSGMAVAITALLTVACSTTSPVAPSPSTSLTTGTTTTTTTDRVVTTTAPTRTDDITHLSLFIRDVNGLTPTTPGTQLYEVRQHNPILAPDGHQVTLAEFTAVEGDKSVKCVAEGTHVVLHLRQATVTDQLRTGDGADPPMPSLRLIQAPVFHGYSFSAWVQFESNPGMEALESSLLAGAIDVRGMEVEPPNNVGQAGQSGIAVGAIAPDRNDAEACWFWLVADNLRLMAENGVLVAMELA